MQGGEPQTGVWLGKAKADAVCRSQLPWLAALPERLENLQHLAGTTQDPSAVATSY